MLHNCFIEQPVVIYFLTLVPTISLYNVLYSYYKQGNLIHVWCAVKYNNTLSTNDFLLQLSINIDDKAAYVQEYLGWTMVYTSKQAISTHNIMVHNIITGGYFYLTIVEPTAHLTLLTEAVLFITVQCTYVHARKKQFCLPATTQAVKVCDVHRDTYQSL